MFSLFSLFNIIVFIIGLIMIHKHHSHGLMKAPTLSGIAFVLISLPGVLSLVGM